MTSIPVTLAASGALGLIYLVLTFQVMAARSKTRIMTGDGANQPEALLLYTAFRSHANFNEYVPLALILLAGLEIECAPHRLLLGLAIVLVIARIAHPFGMRWPAPNPLRAVGALGTWLVILAASIEALFLVVKA